MDENLLNICKGVFEMYRKSMSRNEAEEETRRQLKKYVTDKSKLDAVFENFEQIRRQATTISLSDIDIATREDLLERGWYSPDAEGPLWGSLRERMLNSDLADAVDTIDKESFSIVAAAAEPMQRGDKRKGLVIGNVQSGKTANYASVIAKAVDAGYKFVIVLAGLHNNLREQTQMRLDRDLGVEDGPMQWHRLTPPDDDFGRGEERNAETIASGSSPVLAVVKKNRYILEHLLRFLQGISIEVREKSFPILIIDDESDQATPDASKENAEDTTTINRLVRGIWSEVRNGTYIGYTATPFANIFMSSEDPLDDGHGVDMYPDDFIYAMKTPEAYFGAEKLFGAASDDPNHWSAGHPNVVRDIPNDDKELLLPSRRNGSQRSPQMTSSLENAVKWFVIASAIRRTRGQKDKHSSMLVHTTREVEPHFLTQKIIDDMLEALRLRALDEDVSAFRDIFMSEVNKAHELYEGDAPAPTWNAVAAEIPTVLHRLRTVVDNSKARPEDRLNYTKGPQTVIVIGGGTLSRGLTLEGLFVSYFTRSSNTYDTLLQMGRWFGYRHGYEDLQRIWLSEGLEEDYRHLALVEAEMRDEVRRLIANGDKPKDITVRIRQHPGRLQITNPNKMKNAEPVRTNFEGYRMQTYLFDLQDPQVLDQNLDLTKRFLRQIGEHAVPESSSDRARLFTGVDLAAIQSFVTEFKTDSMNDELRVSAMKWAREQLPDTEWNVVLAGGNGPENTLKDTGFAVKTVTRAPISGIDHRFAHRINIKTLMTGDDYVIDLVLQGYRAEGKKKATLRELKRVRRDPEWGAGHGLLVLYPISRNSSPQRNSQARQPMADALRNIGHPELATPGDESQPIMACAVIMPSDIKNQIRDKATYVGVPRNPEIFDEESDFEGQMPGDREKDYTT